MSNERLSVFNRILIRNNYNKIYNERIQNNNNLSISRETNIELF